MCSLLFADVPPFVMCQGQPAGARSMNYEGLRRRGFTPERVSAVKAMHKLLYRDGLTLEQAANRIRDLSADKPEVQQDVDLMVQFLSNTPAQRGIVR
jgi:UDP-N-acetylglucosamine acyltransferase